MNGKDIQLTQGPQTVTNQLTVVTNYRQQVARPKVLHTGVQLYVQLNHYQYSGGKKYQKNYFLYKFLYGPTLHPCAGSKTQEQVSNNILIIGNCFVYFSQDLDKYGSKYLNPYLVFEQTEHACKTGLRFNGSNRTMLFMQSLLLKSNGYDGPTFTRICFNLLRFVLKSNHDSLYFSRNSG